MNDNDNDFNFVMKFIREFRNGKIQRREYKIVDCAWNLESFTRLDSMARLNLMPFD